MVILDNHVSKPGWCCGNNDGNGFFGDAYFDPDVWVDGLTKMATMFAAVPTVVAMSLRNELRGPRQNSADWYKYMQRGAEAVHAANPRVVVILSGLSFDNDLAFLNSRQVNVSFAGKVAFEVHWYGFSDGQAWRTGNANQVCARVAASVARRALYLLDQGWPVFLSEFGVDNRGGNVNDNRYYGCVAAVAADLDLDWALWTLQGSYYLREGVLGLDEVYGVLDWAWCKPRNDTALTRLHALQRPFRGPGLAEAAPYTVMFHPTTGRCVVRRSSLVQTTLELGSCGETEAWAYTASQQRLSPRDSPLLCLRAEGAGRPARLGLSCGDELARWSLTSDSKLHLAVNGSSSSSSSSETSNGGGGGMLCLDVGDDGRSLVTNPCRCLSSDNSCDPESQWFKLVTSTRSVAAATNTMLAQLPPKLRSWKIRLTWPTYLATNATLANLPLRTSLERLGMPESVAGVRVNNPGLLDVPLIDVFQEVVSALAKNNIMVILDNQMTTPGWCCSEKDGNGFFGDEYFGPEEWLKGLSAMATMFRNTKNVVGMSLRNELRGSKQNVSLWFRYMQLGAEVVHAANPGVLVILSGLDFDNTLNFLVPNQIQLSFTGKLVFEQHWYGFSDGGNWGSQNQNDACGMVVDSVKKKGLFLLQQGWPLFFSEFGFDMSGTHVADNRYLTCFLSVAAEMDLDWAIWALQGSYYIREGTLAYDESYGLLSWDWCTARNPSFIKRINALQSPFQGPGLPNSQEPYNVIFHPLSGLCVLVKYSEALELGPCDKSNAWNYTKGYELILKQTGQCLQAKYVGENAKLGTSCSKSSSKWKLLSNSGMHVSTELTKNGTRVCLDASPDGNITTNQCKCLTVDPNCNPESQWFKIILSSKHIPGGTSILQSPSHAPWSPTSSTGLAEDMPTNYIKI
uniref:Glycoside hydrolase family 5 domain-containing protein n=1 Tax=Oryza punctata TaxID=4537 RepID=A0A0E0KRY7_ORYPU